MKRVNVKIVETFEKIISVPIPADEDESIAIEKIESMYFNGEIKSENIIDEKAIFYEIKEVKSVNKNKIIRLEDLNIK